MHANQLFNSVMEDVELKFKGFDSLHVTVQ
jgi:hypothetical protein